MLSRPATAARRALRLAACALVATATLAAAQAAPPTPAAQAAPPKLVVVGTGDTLYSIAKRHGTTVPALMALNRLASAAVKVGQALALPPESPEGTESLTVGRGDTLHSLAKRFGTTVEALKAVNGLTADRLALGQTLVLPGAGRAAPEDRPAGAAAPASSATVPRAPAPKVARASAPTVARASAPTVVRASVPATVVRGEAPLLWPLDGRITSGFGRRGMFVAGSYLHTGLDIAAPYGTPIRAAAAGRVQSAGWNPYGFGLLVVVRGIDGREYYYAHNSRLEVTAGQEIARGEVVALVGSTGNSTGPHSHFEVRVDGDPVDPRRLLPATVVVPASDRSGR